MTDCCCSLTGRLRPLVQDHLEHMHHRVQVLHLPHISCQYYNNRALRCNTDWRWTQNVASSSSCGHKFCISIKHKNKKNLSFILDTLGQTNTHTRTYYLRVNRAEVRLTLDTQRSPDIFMNILDDTNPEMPTKSTTNSWNTHQMTVLWL